MIATSIPAEMAEEDCWILWESVPDEPGKKPRKVPRIASNSGRLANAKSNDSKTWTSFAKAVIAMKVRREQGRDVHLGFVLHDGWAGIDLDNCLDDAKQPKPWAGEILDGLDGFGYAEISPSGKGVKIFLRAEKPRGFRTSKVLGKKSDEQLEVHGDSPRFYAVTGEVMWNGVGVDGQQKLLTAICNTYLTSPEAQPGARSEGNLTFVSSMPATPALCSMSHPAEVYTEAILNAGETISSGGRNNKIFNVAGNVWKKCEDDKELFFRLMSEINQRLCDPPMSDHELRTTVVSSTVNGTDRHDDRPAISLTSVSVEPEGLEATTAPARPQIVLDGYTALSDLEESLTEATKAGSNLRLLNGKLVHMIADGSLIRLVPANATSLSNELMKHITFCGRDPQGKLRPILLSGATQMVRTALDDPLVSGCPVIESDVTVDDVTLVTSDQLVDSTTFEVIDGDAFFDSKDELEWIINGLVVKGQPLVVGGPSKCLKTSLCCDLVIALAGGGKFMNQHEVNSPQKVLFMSKESGAIVIKKTMSAIADAYDADMSLVRQNYHFAAWLPHAKISERYKRFANELATHKPGVVVIDPVYMATDGEDASNVQKMGQQFGVLASIAIQLGCTPIFVHHSRKTTQSTLRFEPLELVDLQGAGVAEFFRQWILISRRSSFVAGSGFHELWMTGGGSAGHSFEFGVDIHEGEVFEKDTWSIAVRTTEDVKADAARRKQKKADLEEGRRIVTIARRMLYEGKVYYSRSGLLKTDSKTWGTGESGIWKTTLEEMISKKVVVEEDGWHSPHHGVTLLKNATPTQKLEREGKKNTPYLYLDQDAYLEEYGDLPPENPEHTS